MAVYLVESKEDPNDKSLVETRNASVAIRHVALKRLKARSVTTSELVKLMKAGLEVETVTPEEDAATGQPEIPGTETEGQ